jgi:iron complex outermembrane receptor protein
MLLHRGGRRIRTVCAALFVLGVASLATRTVLADTRTEARAHFKKGMRAITVGNYEEGIAELRSAYELIPHPNVLYNIARAYFESGDLEDAIVAYRQYLEAQPADKDEVAQILTVLETRLERQRALAAAAQTAPSPDTSTPDKTKPGAGATGPTSAVAAIGVSPVSAPASAPIGIGQAKPEDVFEESVVTASKGAQSPLDAPNSTSIITEQDIRLSGIVKIPELLRRLAGVDIMETTGSQTEVSLRGFNQTASNKVIVLIDGRSTFIDLIGATFWQTLPIGVEDIERIEVVRGPGSALYGADAFNGVINIITKAPGQGKSGFDLAYGDHDTAHASIYATGRQGAAAYRFSGGFDNVPRWGSEAASNRADVAFSPRPYPDQRTSQRSVRLNADVTGDLGGGVKVGVGGGFVNAGYEIGPYSPLSDLVIAADAIDATAYVTSRHFELRAFYNSLRGTGQLDVENIGQSQFPSLFTTNVVDAEARFNDEERWRSLDNHLQVGLGYRYKDAVWGYIAPNTENWESTYLHDELKIGPRFALVGDFRGDYAPYLAKLVPSPKGSVLFHPTDQSTIRAIFATAFRIPTFTEAYMNVPAQLPAAGASLWAISTDPSIGSTKLKAEQVVTEELGYLNQDSDYFTLDSAVFHNSVRDLIDLAPNRPITFGDLATGNPATGFNTQTNTYPLFFNGFENQCQTYDVYGAELGARAYPMEGLDLYANYTFMDVRTNTSRCGAEQLAGYVPDSRTSAHKVNGGIQVRTKAGIDVAIDAHYVSSQDWALLVKNVQAQKIQYQSFHLDPYTLLNARAGYRFAGNHAEVSAVAFNLLEASQREYPLGQVVGQRFMGMFSYRF